MPPVDILAVDARLRSMVDEIRQIGDALPGLRPAIKTAFSEVAHCVWAANNLGKVLDAMVEPVREALLAQNGGDRAQESVPVSSPAEPARTGPLRAGGCRPVADSPDAPAVPGDAPAT